MAVAAVSRAGANAVRNPFASLVCPSLQSFASILSPKQRLIGLDMSPTHLSLSLSNHDRTRAYTWGLVTRGKDAHTDAMAVMKGVMEAERLEGGSLLDIVGMVVGWRSHDDDRNMSEYVRELIEWTHDGEGGENGRRIFEGLKGVIFYDQDAVVKRCQERLLDFRSAASMIPSNVERLRKVRSRMAMYPRELTQDPDLISEAASRLSASDILQAALDDLMQLKK